MIFTRFIQFISLLVRHPLFWWHTQVMSDKRRQAPGKWEPSCGPSAAMREKLNVGCVDGY